MPEKKVILVSAVLLLGCIALFCINPVSNIYMPKCPIKLITGMNCPACGIQRAIHAALHGNITEAIHYNFFLLFSLPYAMSFVLIWAMPESDFRDKIKKVIENRNVVNTFIIAFTTWFVIRNLLNI